MKKKILRWVIYGLLCLLVLWPCVRFAQAVTYIKPNYQKQHWEITLNAFITAVQADVTALYAYAAVTANWVITVNQPILIDVAPVFVSDHSFTLTGDYTAVLPVGKRLLFDLGQDPMVGNTVASAVYSAPNTTVTVTFNNLTANLQAVSYYATRNGVFTYGSGDIVTSEYGAVSWSTLQTAVAVANAIGRKLIVTPGNWPVSDNLTITAPVQQAPGAVFVVATMKTLTIGAGWWAEPYSAAFSYVGTGEMVFSRPQVVYPEQWGATPTALDQSSYINAAIKSLATSKGWVAITQNLQINSSVLMYPNVDLYCAPGCKLVAGGAITMVKSYHNTVKDYLFITSNLELDGNSLATKGLDYSGMCQSRFTAGRIANINGDAIYCNDGSGTPGAYNNWFGSWWLNTNINGLYAKTNGNDFDYLWTYRSTGYGIVLYGAGNHVKRQDCASCANIALIYSGYNKIDFTYSEGNSAGRTFAAGSYNNKVGFTHYDGGNVLLDVDLGDFGNIAEDFINANAQVSSANLIKNGDASQWLSSSIPQGWYATGVTRKVLSETESAFKIAAANPGSNGALIQGSHSDSSKYCLFPIELLTTDKTIGVTFGYKRETTTISGSLRFRVQIHFYDSGDNLISTTSFSYVSWTTDVDDTTWTQYRQRTAIPTGTVRVGMGIYLVAASAGDSGYLYVKNPAMWQGVVIADNPRTIQTRFLRDGTEYDTPSTGTWRVGDIWERNVFATGKPPYKMVSVAGTLGTLSGVTGTISTGSNELTVNTTVGLYPGAWVTVAGVSGNFQVLNIDGSVCYLDDVSDADVSGAAVAYYAPTFKAAANCP